MTSEKHVVFTFDPDCCEAEAIQVVDSFLKQMQDELKDNKRIVSLDTGECIDVNELYRVRGILSSFIEHYHHWEVE